MSSRAALVLAYNEEETLPAVLSSLRDAQKAGVIDRIVVVDDGSTDNTREVAQKWGAEIVPLSTNRGKAFGFAAGVFYLSQKPPTFVALLDADLERFRPDAIRKLVEPLEKDPGQNMSIGSFKIGLGKVRPEYSGERGLRFAALTPLLKRNLKWLDFFGLKRDPNHASRVLMKERIGYGLEQALAKLLIPRGQISADMEVNCGFVSLRTESRFGVNIMHAEMNAPEEITRQRAKLAELIRRMRKRNEFSRAREVLHAERKKIRFRK